MLLNQGWLSAGHGGQAIGSVSITVRLFAVSQPCRCTPSGWPL